MAVKNIIFDLGGVLLNLDTLRTRESFIKLGVTNFDDLFRIGYAGSFFKDYETGMITDKELIEAVRKIAHPGTTGQQVITAWNEMLLDFPPERVEYLQNLRKKYRLFLFSNTNAMHLVAFRDKYREVYGNDLDDNFEKAYYSHLINFRKPDVEAFEYVINDSGVNAAETIFIDDAPVNIEGAKRAGLQAIHLPPGKTVLDLSF